MSRTQITIRVKNVGCGKEIALIALYFQLSCIALVQKVNEVFFVKLDTTFLQQTMAYCSVVFKVYSSFIRQQKYFKIITMRFIKSFTNQQPHSTKTMPLMTAKFLAISDVDARIIATACTSRIRSQLCNFLVIAERRSQCHVL